MRFNIKSTTPWSTVKVNPIFQRGATILYEDSQWVILCFKTGGSSIQDEIEAGVFFCENTPVCDVNGNRSADSTPWPLRNTGQNYFSSGPLYVIMKGGCVWLGIHPSTNTIVRGANTVTSKEAALAICTQIPLPWNPENERENKLLGSLLSYLSTTKSEPKPEEHKPKKPRVIVIPTEVDGDDQ